MELAVHMKNNKNGEERMKKTLGENASPGQWSCKDFYYGSEWSWTATESFENVRENVYPIGDDYYRWLSVRKKEIKRATAVYSGGNIYLYYAELENGNWLFGDDYSFMIVNANPLTDEESEYGEWQEEHLVTYLSDEETPFILNNVIEVIEEGRTIKEYDNFILYELQARKTE